MSGALGGFELIADLAAAADINLEPEVAQLARELLGGDKHLRRKKREMHDIVGGRVKGRDAVLDFKFVQDALQSDGAAADSAVAARDLGGEVVVPAAGGDGARAAAEGVKFKDEAGVVVQPAREEGIDADLQVARGGGGDGLGDFGEFVALGTVEGVFVQEFGGEFGVEGVGEKTRA